MSKWLLRGLVFAALMVIVRLLQGAMINAWETKAGLISIVLIVLFAVAVFIWGLSDGRADARAHPHPDRGGALAMTWLLARGFAGRARAPGAVVIAGADGRRVGGRVARRTELRKAPASSSRPHGGRSRPRPRGYRRVRRRSRRRHHADRAGAARG